MGAFLKRTFAIKQDDDSSIPEILAPVKRVYYYFVVFVLLFTEFGYIMVSAQDVPGWLRTIILLCSTIPLVVELFKKGQHFQPMVVVTGFLLLIAISSFRDLDFKNHIILAISVFVGYVVSSTIKLKQIAHIFTNIMTFLAAYSLVTFAILVFLPDVANSFPTLYDHYNTTPAEIHNMGLSVVLTKAENFRNFGFTWEPGAFSILLSCALFCNLNFYKKLQPWKTVILTAAIITTFSTTGYFMLAAIFFVAIRKHQKNAKYLRIVVIIAVVSACVALLIPQIRHMVFFKLEGLFGADKVETTQARFNAITYMFDGFISSPLYGVGYKEFNRINRWYCGGVATNTFMNWLAVLGVLFGVPCLYGYVRFIEKSIRLNHGELLDVFAMLGGMFLAISTESLLRISFVYALVFYGLQKYPFGSTKSIYYTKFIDEDPSVLRRDKAAEAIIKLKEKDERIKNRRPYTSSSVEAFSGDVERKKLLFIVGMYYPRYSANGLCVKNVVDECIEKGYDVTCVSNGFYGDESSLVLDRAKVYRVKARLYDRVAFRCDMMHNRAFAKTIKAMAKLVLNVKNVICSPFWPTNTPMYTSRLYKASVRLHEKEHFDAVICAYTPASCVMAGYRLKATYPNVTFIPYFLDALSAGYGPKFFSKKRTVKKGLKKEDKIFKAADKVVVMQSTREHHFAHNVRFKKKMIFLDVPMLKKVSDDWETTEKDGNVKLLYVGSLDPKIRDPQIFIDTLMQLDNERVTVELVGNITCKSMFDEFKDIYKDRLVFTAFLNHDDLAEKISQADVLVNIGNRVSTMVPSKIFEYMSYGKPIVSTKDIDDEPSAKYLSQYPLALILSSESSAEMNAEKLSKFLSTSLDKKVEFESLEKGMYLNTPEAFIKEVIED